MTRSPSLEVPIRIHEKVMYNLTFIVTLVTLAFVYASVCIYPTLWDWLKSSHSLHHWWRYRCKCHHPLKLHQRCTEWPLQSHCMIKPSKHTDCINDNLSVSFLIPYSIKRCLCTCKLCWSVRCWSAWFGQVPSMWRSLWGGHTLYTSVWHTRPYHRSHHSVEQVSLVELEKYHPTCYFVITN